MMELIEKIEKASDWKERQDILKNAGLKEYKTSLARGYHSTKGVTAEEYEGRYGKGVKIHSNRPRTNQYHDVTYYVAS